MAIDVSDSRPACQNLSQSFTVSTVRAMEMPSILLKVLVSFNLTSTLLVAQPMTTDVASSTLYRFCVVKSLTLFYFLGKIINININH